MQAALKAAEVLERESCLVKVAVVPDGMDPDEYIRLRGARAFKEQVLESAMSVTAFQLEQLKKGRRLDDQQELSAYLDEALRVISRLNRAVEREHYLRQLSEEFLLPLDVLKKDLYRVYKQERHKQAKDPQQVLRVESTSVQETKLVPAYINAERMLLAYMMHHHGVTELVERYVGNRFNHPLHQRLAAHLYAFNARHKQADLRLFVSTLDDEDLIRLVSQIASLTISPELTSGVFEDYVYQILTFPYLKEIESKEREKKKAEQHGDVEKAAQIAMEIIEMKKKLKNKPKVESGLFETTSWREG
jgi:DNA primase